MAKTPRQESEGVVTPYATQTTVINAGEFLSNGFSISGVIDHIMIPANWSSASLTVQCSPDSGSTWYDLFSETNQEISMNVTPGTIVSVNADSPLANNAQLRFRSGSRAGPVPQKEKVTITVTAH